MFSTEHVSVLFQKLRLRILHSLNQIDGFYFEECEKDLTEMRAIINAHGQSWQNEKDEVLNEVYVVNRFVDLLSSYSTTWLNISKKKYAASWGSLQSSMDHLRSVKKFTNGTSSIILDYFENQLIELEKLYPYKIFVSMGASVEWFECGICGKDIDSLECEHIKGELYRGKLAYATAKKIGNIDHVAMVKYPQDKRCVIQYDDDGPQFKLVRYVTDLLTSKTMSPLSFHHLEYSKRMEKNPDFRKLPRNEKCFCGSGKKYKRCCIDKEIVEFDHVKIIPRKTELSSIFP